MSLNSVNSIDFVDNLKVDRKQSISMKLTKIENDNCNHKSSIDSSTQTDHIRPPYSYIALIMMAINSRPDKRIFVRGIYEYIEENFPYYRKNKHSWQNGIRHNLSLNSCFQKVNRSDWCESDEKGHLWTISSGHENMFDGGNYRRRKRCTSKRVNKSHVKWSQLSAIEKDDNKPNFVPEIRANKNHDKMADHQINLETFHQLKSTSFSVDSLINHQTFSSSNEINNHNQCPSMIDSIIDENRVDWANSNYLTAANNCYHHSNCVWDKSLYPSKCSLVKFSQMNELFFSPNYSQHHESNQTIFNHNYPYNYHHFASLSSSSLSSSSSSSSPLSFPISAVFDLSRPLK